MQSTPKHCLAHLDLYPLLQSVSRCSSALQPLQTPVLVEEEGRRWFQGGQWRISTTSGWDGERVHHCIAEYFSKGMERQVGLHEVETSRHPLRCQPRSGEPEELVGEIEQC